MSDGRRDPEDRVIEEIRAVRDEVSELREGIEAAQPDPRVYLAGQALAGLCSAPGMWNAIAEDRAEAIVQTGIACVALADAVLATLKNYPNPTVTIPPPPPGAEVPVPVPPEDA